MNIKKNFNIYLEQSVREISQNYTHVNLKDYLALEIGLIISIINDTDFLNDATNAHIFLYAANDKLIHAVTSGNISVFLQAQLIPHYIRAIHASNISKNFISVDQLKQAGILVDIHYHQLLDRWEQILPPIINFRKYMCIPCSILHTSSEFTLKSTNVGKDKPLNKKPMEEYQEQHDKENEKVQIGQSKYITITTYIDYYAKNNITPASKKICFANMFTKKLHSRFPNF